MSLGRPFTDWEVRQWLEGAGYRWASGSWYTCHGNPDSLLPDEVLARQTRETTDGITFIDPEIPHSSGPHAR